jgi:Predicted oxidoreductases (related to aryl-alcohol dehydrogenases)
MKFTQLGKSGLTVSRICLGCMSYGTSKWRPWVLDEADARPFYRKALDLGINFFDTADMYSMGVSEEVTGRACVKWRTWKRSCSPRKSIFHGNWSEHGRSLTKAHRPGM